MLYHWLNMGGYGAYIGLAYGFAGIILLINLVQVKVERNNAKNKLRQWFKTSI